MASNQVGSKENIRRMKASAVRLFCDGLRRREVRTGKKVPVRREVPFGTIRGYLLRRSLKN